MKNRYNVALLPITQNDNVINLAKKFSAISDCYLLGDGSLPHITLCQFTAEDSTINSIWESICACDIEKKLYLTFETFSFVTFDDCTFWVSLLPDNCDKLIKMHSIIKDIVKNELTKAYDPHMTLANSKNREYKNFSDSICKQYATIRDEFILSLGKSDLIGQYTEIVFSV